MEIFSKRLKWLREKSGKTQKEVSEIIGVSQQYYGRFEKGTAEPNIETLAKISKLFDENLDFLFGTYNMDTDTDNLFYGYFSKRFDVEKNDKKLQDTIRFMNTNANEIDKETTEKTMIRLIAIQMEKVKEMETALELYFESAKNVPLISEAYLTMDYLNHSFKDFKERYFLNDFLKD